MARWQIVVKTSEATKQTKDQNNNKTKQKTPTTNKQTKNKNNNYKTKQTKKLKKIKRKECQSGMEPKPLGQTDFHEGTHNLCCCK